MKITLIFLAATLTLVSPAHASDFQFGYQRLLMTDQEPGNQVWYQYHEQTTRAWAATARADLLNRFGKSEGKLSPSVTYAWGGIHTLTGELAFAPSAEIFPQVAAALDYGRPVAPGIAASVGSRYSRYLTTRNLELNSGFEYYFPRNWVLVGRLGIGNESYDLSNQSAFHPSATLKTLYYFNDNDRVWTYFGKGVEGYTLGVLRTPATIQTASVGVGAAKFFNAPEGSGLMGVEANLDYQKREGAIPEIVTLTLALNRRW